MQVIISRGSNSNTQRIDHLLKNENLELHFGDLADSSSINKLVRKIQPDEIYNLGSQSNVKVSFDIPEFTADAVALGALRFLEAIKNN